MSFIVLKNQPFTTAEEESFGNIFELFSERPKMMSDSTVKRRIFSTYDQEKEILKSTLQVIKF